MSFVGTYELQSICMTLMWLFWGFPGGSESKESSCNAGDPDLIPGSRRSPGERNGNPLWYSCLENSMDRETYWLQSKGSQRVGHNWVTNTFHVAIIKDSDTTEWLSLHFTLGDRQSPLFSPGKMQIPIWFLHTKSMNVFCSHMKCESLWPCLHKGHITEHV